VERVMVHIAIPEESQVNCVTMLLLDNVCSWWETIIERRSEEVIVWKDFREQFEEQYYS
jgi:hypothetical protein